MFIVRKLSLFVILIIASVLSADLISSKDKILFIYEPRHDQLLHGLPGSSHALTFHVKNNDHRRNTIEFVQESALVGQLNKKRVTLDPWTSSTVEVFDLVFPQNAVMGSDLLYVLSAKKLQQAETFAGANGEKKSIRVSFYVGNRDQEDKHEPTVEHEYSGTCPVSSNSSQCDDYLWQMEFHLWDNDSGLAKIRVHSVGKDSINNPVAYKYRNFEIGTKKTVDVSSEGSCCLEKVAVWAEDIYGNEVNHVEAVGGQNSLMVANLYVIFLTAFVRFISV